MMPTLVIGSAKIAGDIMVFEALSERIEIVDSTTRVVSAGLTGGPILPRRGPTTTGRGACNGSSTVPW